jgi:hypothetical protein
VGAAIVGIGRRTSADSIQQDAARNVFHLFLSNLIPFPFCFLANLLSSFSFSYFCNCFVPFPYSPLFFFLFFISSAIFLISFVQFF